MGKHKRKFNRIRHRATAQKAITMETKRSIWTRVKDYVKKTFAKSTRTSKGPSLWARLAAAAKRTARKAVQAFRTVHQVVIRPLVALVRDFTVLLALALWLTSFVVLPLETMFFTGLGIIALSLVMLGLDWLAEHEQTGSRLAAHALNVIDVVVSGVWLAAQIAGGVALVMSALVSVPTLIWVLVASGVYIGADQIAKRRDKQLVTVGDEVERVMAHAVREGAVRVPFVQAPTASATPAA